MLRPIETLWRDIRLGMRVFTHSPALSAAVVFTFMLGIGANTVMFSTVYAILFKPLPYQDPDRLVFMAERHAADVMGTDVVGITDYLHWRSRARSFDSMAAFGVLDQTLTGEGDGLPVRIVTFSGRVKGTFGVSPAVGRDFLPEETELRPGGPPRRVALITNRLFQQRFGGSADALDKVLVINSTLFTVIGVLPPSFRFQLPSIFGVQREADAIVNMPFDTARFRGRGPPVQVLGRLKEGVSLQVARSEIEAVRSEIAAQNPDSPTSRLQFAPFSERVVGNTRPALFALWIAVGLVLLLACANVANLLLTRATSRQRERAVRRALGAGQIRLAWQSITESMLLAMLGSLAGLLVAFWGVHFIATLGPVDIPRIRDASLDLEVLLFSLLLCTVSGGLSGFLPAVAGFRTSVSAALQDGVRTYSGFRRKSQLHSGLAVVELAIALVLACAAGLMLKSLWVVRSQTVEFAPEHVLTTTVNNRQMPRASDHARYFDDLIREIEALPNVLAAAASGCGAVPFRVAGLPEPPSGRGVNLRLPCVSPHYTSALGLSLVSGRWFADTDGKGTPPVAVVNEAVVRVYSELFPDSGPIIGKRIQTDGPPSGFPTVVGVVRDFRWRPDTDSEPAAFVPSAQAPFRGIARLFVRASGDPAGLAAPLRRIVGRTPGVFMLQPQTLDDQLSGAIAPRRFQTALFVSFAGLALLLAIVGTFGVMSYSITQRTKEIGLRMALGATRGNVLREVFGRGMKLVLAGIAIGLVGSAGLTRLMSGLLYGVRPIDLPTYALVILVLVVVAMAATYIPAKRATDTDPIKSLRHE